MTAHKKRENRHVAERAVQPTGSGETEARVSRWLSGLQMRRPLFYNLALITILDGQIWNASLALRGERWARRKCRNCSICQVRRKLYAATQGDVIIICRQPRSPEAFFPKVTLVNTKQMLGCGNWFWVPVCGAQTCHGPKWIKWFKMPPKIG